MAKSVSSTKPVKTKDVELRPDGWERFEKAVDAAVKAGPKHRAANKSRVAKRAPKAR